jgi:hypothetical protein
MKKLMGSSLAALMAASAITTAFTVPAEAGRRGAGIAAGVFLGLTAAAIAANASRVDAAEHRRWRHRCEDWAYGCRHGYDRACYRFDENCR